LSGAVNAPTTWSWAQFVESAPDLAPRVQNRFLATKHHVLATLRADGSPRVSGVEVQFVGDELAVGMMAGSVKAADLRRDGRFALHANPGDGAMEEGDAKVSGFATELEGEARDRYREIIEPPEPFLAFRLGITEIVFTEVHPDRDRLVITLWRPGRFIETFERK